jgi:hypothetical protein
VYLYPALYDHTADNLPVHPCLQMMSDSEEKLTALLSRRIVCMKKVVEYDASLITHYKGAAAASAEALRTRGQNIKVRMGAAYDEWFGAHKDKYDPAALATSLYGKNRTSALAIERTGPKPNSVTVDLEIEMHEREGSRKEMKLERKRLYRQMKRQEYLAQKAADSAAGHEVAPTLPATDECAGSAALTDT